MCSEENYAIESPQPNIPDSDSDIHSEEDIVPEIAQLAVSAQNGRLQSEKVEEMSKK